jgi:hypothetical protein
MHRLHRNIPQDRHPPYIRRLHLPRNHRYCVPQHGLPDHRRLRTRSPHHRVPLHHIRARPPQPLGLTRRLRKRVSRLHVAASRQSKRSTNRLSTKPVYCVGSARLRRAWLRQTIRFDAPPRRNESLKSRVGKADPSLRDLPCS